MSAEGEEAQGGHTQPRNPGDRERTGPPRLASGQHYHREQDEQGLEGNRETDRSSAKAGPALADKLKPADRSHE